MEYTLQEKITLLEIDKSQLVARLLADMKNGCDDCCGVMDRIDVVNNNIYSLQFSELEDISVANTIKLNTKIIPDARFDYQNYREPKNITGLDFESDGFTYLDSEYYALTNFRVFFQEGNRYLDYALDGFLILAAGGFIIDPLKFTVQDGQHFIIET